MFPLPLHIELHQRRYRSRGHIEFPNSGLSIGVSVSAMRRSLSGLVMNTLCLSFICSPLFILECLMKNMR